MIFAITERSLTPEGHLYILVAYWRTQADMDAGQRPVRVNDFVLMDPTATEQRIVRDGSSRYKRTDGTFVAEIPEYSLRREFEWETVRRDLLGELTVAINDHWALAEREAFPAERDDVTITRSMADRGGVLAAFDGR